MSTVGLALTRFLDDELTGLAGRYNSHLRRQEADLRTFMDDESLTLDPRIDYSAVTGLSSEVRERLSAVRPTSIVSYYKPVPFFFFADLIPAL